MIRDFHLADFFTLANGCCGTAAIFLAMNHLRHASPGAVYAAGVLVVGALLFDVLDGRIARWRHRASALGRELDSLADVISFGVAPACLAFAVGMTGMWDAFALLYFVACGISRLARYNVTADTLAASSGKVPYFEGTPIPTSTVLVLLIAVVGLAWPHRARPAARGVRSRPLRLAPVGSSVCTVRFTDDQQDTADSKTLTSGWTPSGHHSMRTRAGMPINIHVSEVARPIRTSASSQT
jgi:CDP-diacylglycerol---serine O-phosphatidyltransferase